MKIRSAFEFYVRVDKASFRFENAKGASPIKTQEYIYKTKCLSIKYEKFTYEWMWSSQWVDMESYFPKAYTNHSIRLIDRPIRT
jgi:hypothetical protein